MKLSLKKQLTAGSLNYFFAKNPIINIWQGYESIITLKTWFRSCLFCLCTNNFLQYCFHFMYLDKIFLNLSTFSFTNLLVQIFYIRTSLPNRAWNFVDRTKAISFHRSFFFLHSDMFNLFHSTGMFLCPLKTWENLRFSDVFRGYRKIPMTTGLKVTMKKTYPINSLPLSNKFLATVSTFNE